MHIFIYSVYIQIFICLHVRNPILSTPYPIYTKLACSRDTTQVFWGALFSRHGPGEGQVTCDHAAGGPPARIVVLLRIPPSIQHHDISVAGVDAVPPQAARVIRHPGLVLNAVRSAHRRWTVVARRDLAVEKSPERRRVEVEVRAAVDVLRQTHAARLVVAGAPPEIRVAVTGQRRPWIGSVLQRAHTLPVGRF